jgi:hypothetical protein
MTFAACTACPAENTARRRAGEAVDVISIIPSKDFTADLPERIAREWSASVTVQDLNLEDIFLKQHHG